MAQKWPKTAQIWFWCAHMVKTIGNYVWKNFQKFSAFFDRFWSIFIFSLKIHDFSKKNLKNSKKHFFDLWDLLWWVFHMVLALNHWFRPKNEGSKKSVPRNYKSAGSNALKEVLQRGFLWWFNCRFKMRKFAFNNTDTYKDRNVETDQFWID